ncbi:chemotaxis protein CheB [Pseudonocardia sp.]|uniref:chemotaxis protein CheB n=1 Tax=Pseudonocardia sp. TaxID=60912 RepID=UPI002614049C|nr:chemotaxis protein CheB [Pseudonocardia sp.]
MPSEAGARPARLVVVGASAGGVEALQSLVAGLPADLAAAVVVVLHIPRSSPGALPGILDRAGPLPAVTAAHGQSLRPGVVYVAPPDRHVLVEDGELVLSAGPAENGHRPAVDPLFRSAAIARGPAVVGVVLSGTRDDGAAGSAAIARYGGSVLVQDPADALHAPMPLNAMREVPQAAVHRAADIGAVLAALVDAPAGPAVVPPDDGSVRLEVASARDGLPTTDEFAHARPSEFSCPHCHGVLFALPGGPAPRFRCRTGHAWSPVSLVEDQATGVEEALWTAVRALEEKAALVTRLAEDAHANGHSRSAAEFRTRAGHTRLQAERVRELLRHDDPSDALLPVETLGRDVS